MRLDEKIIQRLKGKRIGYSIGERKKRKLNFDLLAELCRSHGFEFIEIDLNMDLEQQGPFDMVIHKWSDLLAAPSDVSNLIYDLQNYFSNHPETIMLDPIASVCTLVDRSRTYAAVSEYSKEPNSCLHIPNFVTIPENTDKYPILTLLKNAKIRFPIVCKPIVAHGSSLSHTMCIIFNEAGLKDLKSPCVAQQFINHNAELFKIFVIGNEYHCVRRPSIKNFQASGNHEVSKARSSSFLNECDEKRPVNAMPDDAIISSIVRKLRTSLDLKLFGVDVIIDNITGLHYVIDVNFFPGYDGFPNFFASLFKLFYQVIEGKRGDCFEEINGNHQNGITRNGISHNGVASQSSGQK
ncbi:Inositol-tetrakisphosphate 1-kinase [Trichoplax sp. H2]|nr:Inositol-tetrakisphosphate 1-kinase [Trichoplax sp. H2]|eukprot:RDD44830.1 Inositol-tetrakisphosphate 1-kinase [Trichoplax sp. H2]